MASSLSYFFHLQVKRMHRSIGDWGVNPWLVYLGAPLLFVGGSLALFSRTAYANWMYSGLAGAALLQVCGSTRLRFLRQVFNRVAYWRIRMLENMLVVVPFVLFLSYRGEIWFVLGLMALALALLPLRIGASRPRALPTPFSGHPFEFAVGFRNLVGVLCLAYGLMVIGIWVGNGHLSIATLPLVVLLCSNNYAWSEPPLYVWIYRLTPRSFLWLKVRTAVRHLSVILFPMVLAVACFFQDDWIIVLGVVTVGYGYLALAVLAKYAAFPRNVSILQGIIMALSLIFPPLLLVSVPYFFRRARNNISLIL